MLNLARNTFLVKWKNYLGDVPIVDEYGNDTGSKSASYGSVKQAYMAISPNRGASSEEMFGSALDYDRVMTTADTTCDINEFSILWIDGVSTESPHNYIVKKVAPWKNSISYAIKKVDVSNA